MDSEAGIATPEKGEADFPTKGDSRTQDGEDQKVPVAQSIADGREDEEPLDWTRKI